MYLLRFVVAIITVVIPLARQALSQEMKPMKVVRQPVVREFNPAFKGKTEEKIEALEHQLADAIRLKDEAKLDLLLSDTLLVAGIIADKKQFIALIKLREAKYMSMEKSEMRVQVYGDTAIATGLQKTDKDIEGGSEFSQTIFMNAWKRIHGKWRCIAFAS